MSIVNTINPFGSDDDEADEQLIGMRDGNLTQVSPESAKLEVDTIRSGNKWLRTLYVAGLPPNPKPRLLHDITSHSSANVEFNMRVEPIDPDIVNKRVNREIRDAQINRMNAKDSGRLGQLQDATKNLKRLLRVKKALDDDAEEIFRAGIYVTIRHEDKGKCKRAAKDIRRRMRQRSVVMKEVHWRADKALRQTAPIPENALGPGYMTVMTGSAVGTLYPFTTNTILEEEGILYGWNAKNQDPVKVDRWGRRNGYNMVVTGDIGAGKSYGISLFDTREYINNKDLITIIVDPRDAFGDLCDERQGDRIVVGGDTYFNPLEITRTPDHIVREVDDLSPYNQNKKSKLAFFTAYFTREESMEGLGTLQYTILEEAIDEAYRRAGIFPNDYASHDNPSPTIPDLKDVLRYIEDNPEDFIGRDETERTIDNYEDAANFLRTALEPFTPDDYCDLHPEEDDSVSESMRHRCDDCQMGGTYAHLSKRSNFSIEESNFIYIDLQQYENDRDLGIMMKLVWDAIYNRTKNSKGHVHTVIDEFHTILNNEYDLEWLENEYRHSRHFDNAITAMSQRSEDFSSHPMAETVVELSSMSLSFKNENLSYENGKKLGFDRKNHVDFIRQCKPGDKERGWGHALLKVGDQQPVPIRVQALPAEMKLIDREAYNAVYPDGHQVGATRMGKGMV